MNVERRVLVHQPFLGCTVERKHSISSLSFIIRHAVFDIAAVLFRSYRMRQPNDLLRTPIRQSVTALPMVSCSAPEIGCGAVSVSATSRCDGALSARPTHGFDPIYPGWRWPLRGSADPGLWYATALRSFRRRRTNRDRHTSGGRLNSGEASYV